MCADKTASPALESLDNDERRRLLRKHARQEATASAKVLETKLKQWQNIILAIAQSQCQNDMARSIVKTVRDPPLPAAAPMQTDANDELIAMFGTADDVPQ